MNAHSLASDPSLLVAYFLVTPTCLGVAAVASGLLVWNLKITNYKTSQLLGLGAVPLVIGGIIFGVLWRMQTFDFVLFFRFMWAGVGGSVLGGYIGSLVSCRTLQARSDRPDVQRAYRAGLEALAASKNEPPLQAASVALRRAGLPDTPGDTKLYYAGLLLCLIWLVAFLFWMLIGGLLDPEILPHLPPRLRLIGGMVAPIPPALLWGLTYRKWPALGLALRAGILFIFLPLTMLYSLLNVMISLHG